RCLKFEITESAIMESATEAVKITDALRSRHIEISIDDFGTGYSSLGHLHQFSLDNLKIDRSFVDQINKPNGRHSYVVNTIVALGQQLGLAVIAEGIETEAQIQYLRNLGCEYGQGFLFAKPLPAAEFEAQYLCPPSEAMPSALASAHRPRSTH
ncbi:MAG: EAL domain-containing protein, partial [Cyanobacteria bacterium P01_H01_bin.130]